MTTPLSDIALTEHAARRIHAILANESPGAVFRISVEGGGCSGFQYRFGFADAPDAGDTVAETDGVQLVVDEMSLDLVRGCAVDYVESLGGASFKVENPNAASGCGCGTSFSV
jgi:iron-sulfur cluster assembly accessory protein